MASDVSPASQRPRTSLAQDAEFLDRIGTRGLPLTINEGQALAWAHSERAGFHDDDRVVMDTAGIRGQRAVVALKLALLHEEVSEALSEIRDGDMSNGRPWNVNRYREDGKPEGFPSEIADAVIRCFDLAEIVGFDLETAIIEKMRYNLERPRKHGRNL